MNTRHVVDSTGEACCSACGGTQAIVRMRGNAFAATCTNCRETTIAPMLAGDELDDVCGDRGQLATVTPIVPPKRTDSPMWDRIGVQIAALPPLDPTVFGVTLRT